MKTGVITRVPALPRFVCSTSLIAIASMMSAQPAAAQATDAPDTQTEAATTPATEGKVVTTTSSAQAQIGASGGGTDQAQSTPTLQATDASGNDLIVTGYRQSLQSAQSLKRNSDSIVDSVTAEDIGALPDRSVVETLQRIPGVSISRFAAGVDPDHFSVEGS